VAGRGQLPPPLNFSPSENNFLVGKFSKNGKFAAGNPPFGGFKGKIEILSFLSTHNLL